MDSEGTRHSNSAYCNSRGRLSKRGQGSDADYFVVWTATALGSDLIYIHIYIHYLHPHTYRYTHVVNILFELQEEEL